LRRFAISDDAPKNLASRMLAIMVRLIRRSKPEITTLVSYQDTDTHAGTIYRAAGWAPREVGGGGQWNSSRKSRTGERIRHKIRWEKTVSPVASAR
jgi:hypothetical protein